MRNTLKLDRSSRRIQSGFTLIELMITVTVVGILAAVAFPSFNYAIQNSRVRTAVSDTHTSLLLARSEAIKRNGTIELSRNGASWLDGWTIQVQADATQLALQDPFVGVAAECYITTNASTACGSTLVFERTGRAGSYIEFRYYNASNTDVPMRCVKVSVSGRPNVSLDSNNNPADGCN